MKALLTILIFILLFSLQAKESNLLDKVHSSVAQTWNNANNGLDTFFANKTFAEEESEGYLQLSFSHRINEHGIPVNNFDFRMKTSFPQTTKDLKFVIKDDTAQDQIGRTTTLSPIDSSPTDIENAATASKYSAILQYNFLEQDSWKITTDQGMRIDLPLNPFIQLRARYSSKISILSQELELNIIQRLRYYYQEKFSENSEVQLYKKLNHNMGLTFSTGVSWSYDTEQFTLGHGLSLHHKLSEKMAITYYARASALLSSLEYNSLSCGVSLTRQLYDKWFYGSLSLGSDFTRTNGFYSNNYAYFSGSILF